MNITIYSFVLSLRSINNKIDIIMEINNDLKWRVYRCSREHGFYNKEYSNKYYIIPVTRKGRFSSETNYYDEKKYL